MGGRENMRKICWFWSLCCIGIAVILAGPHVAALAAPNHAAAPVTCNAGWVYDHVTLLGLPFVPFGPDYQDYNGTDHDELAQFTASTAGRVRVRTSFGWFIDTTILLSTIRRSLDREVQSWIEVEVGNQIQMTIPPHKVGYARYGVYEVQAKGDYFYRDSSCHALFPQGGIVVWCPWYSGWDTKIIDRDHFQEQKGEKQSEKS
jgi:hypothetical protein